MATSAASSSKERNKEKYAERMAFSKFVSTKKDVADEVIIWRCCSDSFKELRDIHKHVAKFHSSDVELLRKGILQNGDEDARWSVIRGLKRKNDSTQENKVHSEDLPVRFVATDILSWLPAALKDDATDESKSGRILLFYKYRDIENAEHVKSWQEELCRRLQLTGKIRVAKEGLNATVGGSSSAIEIYKSAVMAHPLFNDMTPEDFKESEGGAESFGDGLKVGIYKEAVPLGVDPSEVSFVHAGKHLNPEEFHNAVENHLKNEDSKSVFIDCRNFFESKIGCFKGAIAPDIRKFSYWPEYVEKNKEFLKDKSVYMYCTGGIRCERGSAYLRQKNICQDVYQLKGGIHKYMEKYPDGYFRGKLFVFDDRYSIKANEDEISCCVYCGSPWDEYAPCSSGHCHQLVLSCTECRSKDMTACCKSCKNTDDQETGQSREECECTRRRNRIPSETNKPMVSSSFERNIHSSSNNDKHSHGNNSSSNGKR